MKRRGAGPVEDGRPRYTLTEGSGTGTEERSGGGIGNSTLTSPLLSLDGQIWARLHDTNAY